LNLDKRIYKKLLKVPRGYVTTYGELSKSVGLKNGQRLVGKIMNKNPCPVIIPCHRVVLSTGKVGGYTFGENVKATMLNDEGIQIENGKIIDLKNKFYRF